jgi:hypothetical protein
LKSLSIQICLEFLEENFQKIPISFLERIEGEDLSFDMGVLFEK